MKLKCSICKREYADKESIIFAIESKKDYIRLCKDEGFDAKGICPCPIISCKGEMILIDP